MQEFSIKAINTSLDEQIKHKIDFKTKPIGSLGKLEEVAFKVCQIQQTLTPELKQPALLVCAGDHGITEEGVSPFPQEVTHQMVLNFLSGGAAINVFCRQNNIQLLVADTGVNFDFESTELLLNRKVRKGTRNFVKEPAMTLPECHSALTNGAEIVSKLHDQGTNVVGFGEMGIGNTTSATALLCKLTNISPQEAAGAGTGLNKEGIAHKASVIEKALLLHQQITNPTEILAAFGGYEIATICGGMLKAAELGMIILVDGFIATSAVVAAHAINPEVIDFCLFTHQSNEQGHRLMLEHLQANPILDMGLRLGEGTGAALAYPLIQSAVNFINEMNSFEDAGVSNKE